MLLSILLCSCYKSSKKEGVHAQLKDEVYSIVVSYMDSHPQYNTFILTEAMEQTMSGIKTSGYFLGPGYPRLLPPEKSTSYLDILLSAKHSVLHPNSLPHCSLDDFMLVTSPLFVFCYPWR